MYGYMEVEVSYRLFRYVNRYFNMAVLLYLCAMCHGVIRVEYIACLVYNIYHCS